jgi:biotin carboxyl carrier protein
MHRWQFSHEHANYSRIVTDGFVYESAAADAKYRQPFSVVHLDRIAGRAELSLAGKPLRVDYVAGEHGMDVIVAGHFYRLTPGSATGGVKGSGNTGELRSEIPGRIVKVLVEQGAVVNPGTVLVIQEAMKMELTIRAPVQCKVEEIFVREGDQVDADAPLVRWARAEN